MTNNVKITVSDAKDLKAFFRDVTKLNGSKKITDPKIEDRLILKFVDKISDGLKTDSKSKNGIADLIVVYLKSCPKTFDIVKKVRDCCNVNISTKEMPNIINILDTLISVVEAA
jgi:hypothetical protein